MRRIYKLIASMAEMMGFFIGRLPPVSDNLQSHLKLLFERLEINCVLDIGAHYGEYGKLLRDNGYTGRIISWEPVSKNFQELIKLAGSDKSWIAYNFALGNSECRSDIHITEATNLASFLMPSEYGHKQLGGKISIKGTEAVDIKRLDTIFEDCMAGIGEPACA
jgi:FkbM family methyltransferase